MSSLIIAKRYAKAYYNSLKTAQKKEEALKDMEFIASCFDKVPAFSSFIKLPDIDESTLNSIIDSVFNKNITPGTSAFIHFIHSKQRLEILNSICTAFIDQYREDNRISLVSLESAFDLNSKEITNLTTLIGKKLNRKVELSTAVNPDLIGGIRFSANNEIYDFTLANELTKFKRQLING